MESQQNPVLPSSPVTPGASLSSVASWESNSRFHGDGVRYKAKLIGIDHVTSAEGEKMCWDSMMKLKGFEEAFRKQGRHKQRVWLKICSKGVRILDERTGGEMYVHEKSHISAVTRDESDPRALAYVHQHTDNYYLFYLRMATLAEPVLSDIREVCRAVEQEPAQESPSEAPQALLVVEEASTLSPEEPALEPALENVFSPRLDSNPQIQTSASSELMEIFCVPLKDPMEPDVCHAAVPASAGVEPPKPALSNMQILSMFSPQPGGAPYSSSPWAQQGVVGPQWAGPVGGAAVAPWPTLPNHMTACPPAVPPSGPVMNNTPTPDNVPQPVNTKPHTPAAVRHPPHTRPTPTPHPPHTHPCYCEAPAPHPPLLL